MVVEVMAGRLGGGKFAGGILRYESVGRKEGMACEEFWRLRRQRVCILDLHSLVQVEEQEKVYPLSACRFQSACLEI